MANFKYFSDTAEHEPVELLTVTHIPNQEFLAKFPGVKGMRYDGYSMWVGRAASCMPQMPVTRKIEFKSNPSLHRCGAKCLGGKRNGVCECQCGGKNHGAGMLTRMLESS